jgi:hypothetical protein
MHDAGRGALEYLVRSTRYRSIPPEPPGLPVTSAPSIWNGEYQAALRQPAVRHETRKWPSPPAHPHTVHETETVPGFQT